MILLNTKIKKAKQESEVLPGLVRQARRTLVEARSHFFPVDLFPDTIKVDEEKVTVITRTFLLSSEVHGVDLKDVTNVFINTSPFFAQLVIVSKTFEENIIQISSLWLKDAIYVRRIIEGMRVMLNKQVDTSVYSKIELLAKLEELTVTDEVVE